MVAGTPLNTGGMYRAERDEAGSGSLPHLKRKPRGAYNAPARIADTQQR